MSARVLTRRERQLLEEMGFNTIKIQNRLKRENNQKRKAQKRKKRYSYN